MNSFVRAVWRKCMYASTAVLFCPTAAQAAPGWTSASAIDSYLGADTSLTVILPSAGNPLGCGSTTWYRLPTTAANYQTISAIILSAAGQGRRIQVYATACQPDGASQIIAAWVVP